MSLKTEMRIHGNVVEIENLLQGSLVKWRNARGKGFRESSNKEVEYWFHIPIPTPSILDGVKTYLSKIFINYSCGTENAAVYIREVHLFDGNEHFLNKPFWKASGSHNQKKWDINPQPPIRYGLGITVKVVFGKPHPEEGTSNDRHIMFHAAGAEFKTP